MGVAGRGSCIGQVLYVDRLFSLSIPACSEFQRDGSNSSVESIVCNPHLMGSLGSSIGSTRAGVHTPHVRLRAVVVIDVAVVVP